MAEREFIYKRVCIVDMQTYQYREGAFDCLVANKEKLGITEELVSQILRELDDQYTIEDWKTEWLTYNDRWVYFELKFIDEEQKMKLWSLVEELISYYDGPEVHTKPTGVSILLTHLQTYI